MVHSDQYQDICILRLSAIGDVCHAVSAVQAIQRHNSKARITWVLGKVEAMLLADLPDVKFVIFDKKQGKAAYNKLKEEFKGKKFDVLLHMQVALRANIAAAYIPAKIKMGFDWSRCKEGHAIFTNKRISSQSEPHVLEGFQGFAKAIGVPHYKPSWQMPYTENDLVFANTQLDSFGIKDKKVFVISAAASKKERNWLPERYAALAKHAHEKGFKVVLTGGPVDMERELACDIQRFCDFKLLNLVGKTNLKQLLCILKCADLVLAPDTGPAHMAVTMNTPVIGLYAHSNPKRTGPYLYQEYAVEVYHKNLKAQFGKTAQQLPWGKRCKGKNLMSQIQTHDVVNMFDRIVIEKNILESK
ncbi:glycosyltransferase family 9 protein [Pseudoalteromonas denitrificans]|uniref:Heptosyltransferase I n=1 Tax=Pseudoalteromonas denitrificans DSM 6059 TaxID=1123010 RepID=A0A1I1DW35_9GAMM|nr:glycosyltransferase family 9 protein [Pseudoalteromonas denitrificans]SFB78616.1 heptosyltransferase I [Pseudoalteromonas denitrificans DSM 6059]